MDVSVLKREISAQSRPLLGLAYTLLVICAVCPKILAQKETYVETTSVSKAVKKEEPMQNARDPDIAIKEEYGAAIKVGTVKALNLFVARHPESPLADRAQRALKLLRKDER